MPPAAPSPVLAVLTPDGPQLADPAVPLVRADDPGVVRGESVFETLRVHRGRAFAVEPHLQRLARSAERLELPLPAGVRELLDLASSSFGADGSVRVICTRGGVTWALASPMSDDAVRGREQGVAVVTLTLGVPAGLRATAPWLLGGVKSTSYAVNMAALREAHAAGADDAVLVSSDGEVLEAPTATVAWVTGETLVTPPPEGVGILPGTTMDLVLELAAQQGLRTEVRRAALAELLEADEVLLTGSVRGVAPVTSVDGRAFPLGQRTARLRDALEELVARSWAGTPRLT